MRAPLASLISLVSLALAACSTLEPVPQTVHVANVTTSTFCKQMSTIDASGEKKFALDWDVDDTPETATKIEKVGERYKAACRKGKGKP